MAPSIPRSVELEARRLRAQEMRRLFGALFRVFRRGAPVAAARA